MTRITLLRVFKVLTAIACVLSLSLEASAAPPVISADCEPIEQLAPTSIGPQPMCFGEPYYVILKVQNGVEGWVKPGTMVDLIGLFSPKDKPPRVNLVACSVVLLAAQNFRCKEEPTVRLRAALLIPKEKKNFLEQLEQEADFFGYSLSLASGYGGNFEHLALTERLAKLCECDEGCKTPADADMRDPDGIALHEQCSCTEKCLGKLPDTKLSELPAPSSAKTSRGPGRNSVRIRGRSYVLRGGRLVPAGE